MIDVNISDLDKKNIALLRASARSGKANGNFIEVMACPGGCITGPSAYNDVMSGRKQIDRELLKIEKTYETVGL